MGEFALPDLILREHDLKRDLDRLAEDVGITSVALPESEADTPYTLADVYDPELETLAQDVYQRDYVMFGYQDWTAS